MFSPNTLVNLYPQNKICIGHSLEKNTPEIFMASECREFDPLSPSRQACLTREKLHRIRSIVSEKVGSLRSAEIKWAVKVLSFLGQFLMDCTLPLVSLKGEILENN